jgi:hypothetical protein
MIAWVLNFDADLELAHGPGYTPSKKVEARLHQLVEASGLVGPKDAVLYPTSNNKTSSKRPPKTLQGHCWCPTPTALQRLGEHGLRPPDSPSIDILQQCNRRDFIRDVVTPLPCSTSIQTVDEFSAHQAAHPTCQQWRLKRPYGFSGQGQLLCDRNELGKHQRRWLDDGLRRFGWIHVEANVERQGDYSMHGHISPEGRISWGQPCKQYINGLGQWLRTIPTSEICGEELTQWMRECGQVADKLVQSKYHGPFGIDAFRYTWRGKQFFQACCDLNARYTMAWTAGMNKEAYHFPNGS